MIKCMHKEICKADNQQGLPSYNIKRLVEEVTNKMNPLSKLKPGVDRQSHAMDNTPVQYSCVRLWPWGMLLVAVPSTRADTSSSITTRRKLQSHWLKDSRPAYCALSRLYFGTGTCVTAVSLDNCKSSIRLESLAEYNQ